MTDDEAVLRAISMIGFGELSRTAEKEWWCYMYEVTCSGRQERHIGNGDTAAQACRCAVAALERASGMRGV